MFRVTSRWGWCLAAILVAVFAADVVAQGSRSNTKIITWQSAPSAEGICVGILGEIAKPGVYRLDAGSLSVQSVVRRAGGLTGEASRTIHIVRQDRVIQSLFFSPQADSRLLPGDLLVVESKRAQSAIGRVLDLNPRDSAIQPASATSAEPVGVQVAFLNVLDDPVVVKLRPEDATREHVVLKLGQPIELAGSVKLLGPERASAALTLSSSGPPRLTDGTVLVFPRGAVNRRRLPADLPKPFDSDIAAGAQPSLIGNPFGQSTELRNVGQLAPLVARPFTDPAPPEASFNRNAAPVQAPAPPIAPPVPQPSSMPIVSSPSRIATVPFTGMPRLTTSASRAEIEPESNAPVPQDEVPSKASPSAAPAQTIDKSSADIDAMLDGEEPRATSSGSGPFSIWQMLGIFGCVTTLIGLSLLTRRYFDAKLVAERSEIPNQVTCSSEPPALTSLNHTETAAPAEAPVTEESETIQIAAPTETSPASGQFGRLIRNELPLRQERVEFPQAIVLQGSVAPRMIHRVDKAMATPLGDGPHFAVKAPSSDVVARDEIAIISEPDAPSEPHARGPHFGRRRTVTPPVASGIGLRNEDVGSLEPTPPTPLADALRQLQGGQS